MTATEPNVESVYETYYGLFEDCGGDLAYILTSCIIYALIPEGVKEFGLVGPTEAEFNAWYTLIAVFLANHKYQINDQNQWDYLRDHPGLDNITRAKQTLLDKYPYLHFIYGKSGGERAFQMVIRFNPKSDLQRRLKLLQLLVQYWPNHRYSHYQRDSNYENTYFFDAYLFGPEFRTALDPNGEFYTEAWVARTKEQRREEKKYIKYKYNITIGDDGEVIPLTK